MTVEREKRYRACGAAGDINETVSGSERRVELDGSTLATRPALIAAHEDAFAPERAVTRASDHQVRVAVAIEITEGGRGGGMVHGESCVSRRGLAQVAVVILEEVIGPALEAMAAVETTRVADVHIGKAIAVEINDR